MPINNSVYRLLAVQIPMFWEAIKYACIEADEVDKKDYANYFNDLLQALLSDKAQCFVILDKDRILHGVAITKIVTDKILLKKELTLQVLYSMRPVSDAELFRNLKILRDLAIQEGCFAVTFQSRNPRIWEMAKISGCTERNRSFIYEVGGN